jgi:Fic family protein
MDIFSIHPLMPESTKTLQDLALTVATRSGEIAGKLHPTTSQAVEDLLRIVNSYYSNLIEGNSTHPSDIERATRGDLDTDPANRELQLESKAHIYCQKKIDGCIKENTPLNFATPDFLRWIHKTFYDQMPDAMQYVTHSETQEKLFVYGGKFRERSVKVGRHVPPDSSLVPGLLDIFAKEYGSRVHGANKIIAAAAAHHRLMWVHPFLDGNGRVARLFTDAYFKNIPLPGYGIWNVSRGLARDRDNYRSMLAVADKTRQGNYDGRGYLSSRHLTEFCEYFLDICVDQISYMSGLLDLDGLLKRVDSYVNLRHTHIIPDPLPQRYQGLKKEAAPIIKEVILQGELGRGEAAAYSGLKRAGRDILKQLVDEKILISDMPKSPVRFGLPTSMAVWIFPELYPNKEIAK